MGTIHVVMGGERIMTEGQIKDGLKLLGGIGQHMMYASLLLSSRMEGLVILLLLCMIFTLLRPIFITPGDLGRQGMAANKIGRASCRERV